jgi:uncharacterized protein YjbI with pentapeptide repeats
MGFYGRSNRLLVEQALKEGVLRDSQICGCDLSGLKVERVLWERTDMRDLHADDIEIRNTKLEGSNFTRSGFMRAKFEHVDMEGMVLDGLTLIKSGWRSAKACGSTMKNLCLQRAVFSESRFTRSSFLDFEALDMRIENCVFAHCMFAISYGSGLNGFSNGEIKNSIFYHCRFEGYPLRGAKVKSSVFSWCTGQIGDEMECENAAGLGLKGNARGMGLKNADEGRRLIERYAS